jgi:hypothetical protein
MPPNSSSLLTCNVWAEERLNFKSLWNYNKSNTTHTADRLNFKGRGTVIRFPAGAKDFSLLVGVQIGSEPTQPSIKWLLGAVPLEVKRQERKSDH